MEILLFFFEPPPLCTSHDVRELKLEKETILLSFQQLKQQMSKSRGQERQELVELTVQSRASIDALRKKLELAEQVIRQGEICRKLETEEEKVIPYYAESVTQEQLAEAGGKRLWL